MCVHWSIMLKSHFCRDFVFSSRILIHLFSLAMSVCSLLAPGALHGGKYITKLPVWVSCQLGVNVLMGGNHKQVYRKWVKNKQVLILITLSILPTGSTEYIYISSITKHTLPRLMYASSSESYHIVNAFLCLLLCVMLWHSALWVIHVYMYILEVKVCSKLSL